MGVAAAAVDDDDEIAADVAVALTLLDVYGEVLLPPANVDDRLQGCVLRFFATAPIIKDANNAAEGREILEDDHLLL